MTIDVSVVASQAAAIREVGGDAYLYFDPSSEEDLLQLSRTFR